MTRPTVAALAAGLAVVFAASGCTAADVHQDYTDTEVLATMEAFVAESIAVLDAFPGFHSRNVSLEDCLYGVDRNESLEGHDTVHLTYEFPEASWEDPTVRETYPEILADHWEALGHEVEVDRNDAGEISHVNAVRDDGIGIYLTLLGKVLIETSLGGGAQCTEIGDGEFTIPEPTGGVLPENDRFTDNGPRDST
ncbi:hypothetical protein [Glycomyces paridis]|uniref:DUF4853 domain-containing protein n=1 Tax=Glycomyces paridis TaxID=2126555 RepID=A0A4S8PGW1_9ACTN|nr:hypothetical protein [Glycomyces paridis]THV27564.1 hypothetical protein E9998_14220 [Glycomyces paridis]